MHWSGWECLGSSVTRQAKPHSNHRHSNEAILENKFLFFVFFVVENNTIVLVAVITGKGEKKHVRDGWVVMMYWGFFSYLLTSG